VNVAGNGRFGKPHEEASMISVTRKKGDDPLSFEVVVGDERSETRHQVTMTRDLYARLAQGKCEAEALIEAAFRFLLDREPKESILRRFDASVIAQYFPEFERELPRYLSKR
jgi:hypothetical protein